jgi:hypothetical protein
MQEPRSDNYPTYLRVPLRDEPFNSNAPADVPSMIQSLQLSQDFYMALHTGLSALFKSRKNLEPRIGEFFALLGVDAAVSSLPLSSSWLHEEWHRAILGQYGYGSHNGVYNFEFKDSIPVDRVRDEDLIELKAKHPADMVRLSSAGMEAESELALTLEKDLFFREVLPRQQILIALNHWGPISYRSYCPTREADKATDLLNQEEGSSIKKRDFTGFDCTAYVYDLFRPDEPYAGRGNHPHGPGINRYRKTSDLTGEEKKYLRRMADLSYVNLIDPFMWNVNGFDTASGRFNATLRHHLAPFGHSLEQNLFWKNDQHRFLVILRQYFNKHAMRPGIEFEHIGIDLSSWTKGALLDYWLALWQQPRQLRFDARRWQTGGRLGARLTVPLVSDLALTSELESKTRGWAASRVTLGAATEGRLGLEWRW